MMTGDIRAGRLSVEENAVFSGKVELSGALSSAGAGDAEPAKAERTIAAPAATAPALFGAN
jgi:hypothetical protein